VRAWLQQLGSSPGGVPKVTIDAAALADDFGDALSRHRDLQLRALDDLDERSDGVSAGPLQADKGVLDELGPRLLPVLRKLAGGNDRVVAARAIQVMAKIPGSEAALAEAASSPRIELRLAALSALDGRRLPSLSPQLAKALAAADWRERRLAVLALASNA